MKTNIDNDEHGVFTKEVVDDLMFMSETEATEYLTGKFPEETINVNVVRCGDSVVQIGDAVMNVATSFN